ncbi:hypothetical protein OK006_3997 [Actinobacteria bacterium OK006]|nr:hypothetical protein OK006_3997 [Actinobacteria bacterium OK006]
MWWQVAERRVLFAARLASLAAVRGGVRRRKNGSRTLSRPARPLPPPPSPPGPCPPPGLCVAAAVGDARSRSARPTNTRNAAVWGGIGSAGPRYGPALPHRPGRGPGAGAAVGRRVWPYGVKRPPLARTAPPAGRPSRARSCARPSAGSRSASSRTPLTRAGQAYGDSSAALSSGCPGGLLARRRGPPAIKKAAPPPGDRRRGCAERRAGLAPASPRRKRGVFPWTTNARPTAGSSAACSRSMVAQSQRPGSRGGAGTGPAAVRNSVRVPRRSGQRNDDFVLDRRVEFLRAVSGGREAAQPDRLRGDVQAQEALEERRAVGRRAR